MSQSDLFAMLEPSSSLQDARGVTETGEYQSMAFAGRLEAPIGFQLRPYQADAADAVLAELETVRGTMLVLPVGAGKTRVFGEVALRFRERRLRTLVIAHSVILVDQAYESLRRIGLRVGVEQAERSCLYSRPDVVVATVQTLRAGRITRYEPTAFGLVVCDESHRALSKMHRGVFEHFAQAKLLGVTATPDRTDRVGLHNVFDTVAYQRDMLWGIQEGWLAPLELRTCATKWDPKQLKTIAGDVDPGSVERELIRSGVLADAAATLAELGAGRRVVAFLPTVAAARAFGVELLARGIPSGSIDGETDPMQRERLFRDLREGRITVLSNCLVLTEGFDLPAVDTIALLSPTKSRSRLVQCLGRGARKADGKNSCLVLDYCPGRLRKGRLASPADALAGKMLDDKVAELVEDGDLAKAIARAELKHEELEQLRRDVEEREARKREARERGKQDVRFRPEVDYSLTAHDAAAVLGGDGDDIPGDVSQLIARPRLTDEQRKQVGIASEKQAKHLSRLGMNPYMKRQLAGEVMAELASSGWRMTDKLRNDKRLYAGTRQRDEELTKAWDRLKLLGMA